MVTVIMAFGGSASQRWLGLTVLQTPCHVKMIPFSGDAGTHLCCLPETSHPLSLGRERVTVAEGYFSSISGETDVFMREIPTFWFILGLLLPEALWGVSKYPVLLEVWLLA